MPNDTPTLYLRKKTESGWRWESLEEIRGRRTSDIAGKFAFRPTIAGKQLWKQLSATTFPEAKAEALRYTAGLEAQSKGLTVPELQEYNSRLTLKLAVDRYLEQKNNKAPKTIAQYRNTLQEFTDGAGIVYLDEVTEQVLRNYKTYMATKGHAGKTQDTRLNIVFFMLKKNGIKARLPKDEMPIVEEEEAIPFTGEQLERLWGYLEARTNKDGETLDADEIAERREALLRYKFFLGTGCREREVAYAAWDDINWTKKEFHVRRKPDVGFTPKSHESRTIPLPPSLLKALVERRKNPPHPRWVFANRDGRPEGHFLKKLKSIGLRAGLNCGHCKTTRSQGRWQKEQVEVNCKTAPVCEEIYLHRFRKTIATRWAENKISIRTIQHWLGHKSLETTMRYLGVTDSGKLQEEIAAAFGD